MHTLFIVPARRFAAFETAATKIFGAPVQLTACLSASGRPPATHGWITAPLSASLPVAARQKLNLAGDELSLDYDRRNPAAPWTRLRQLGLQVVRPEVRR